MSQDPFANYKLPIGLSDGVNIPLAGTPASFKVRLPGSMNEDFNLELMSGLSVNVDDNGEARIDAMKFQSARRDLFFKTCILDADGLPDGMSADEFFAAYPLAKRAIYDKATELAAKADEEAEDALGKFESTPRGKPSGGGSTTSTKTSSKAA